METDKEKLLAEIELKVTTSCNWWMVNQQTLTSELARWIVDQVASIPFFAAPSHAQAVGGEYEWPDKPGVWMRIGKVYFVYRYQGALVPLGMTDTGYTYEAGGLIHRGGWLPCDVAPRSAPEAGEGETAPAPKTE
jgi:hypothetical protein